MLHFENEQAEFMYVQLRLLGSNISGTDTIMEKLAREVLRSTEVFNGREEELNDEIPRNLMIEQLDPQGYVHNKQECRNFHTAVNILCYPLRPTPEPASSR